VEKQPDTRHRADLLTADAVARRLNVKRATVYAYVSRGFLRRVDAEDGQSLFDPLEVEQISGRSRKAARPPVPSPTFCSALTVIAGGEPHYRGHAVCDLARRIGFEEAAHLLWHGALVPADRCRFESSVPDELLCRVYAAMPASALPLEKLRALVDIAAANDPLRHDLKRSSVTTTVQRLLYHLIGAMPRLGPAVEGEQTIAAALWPRLTAQSPTPALLKTLDATMVLLADHDLGSPSTVAVRVAAAVQADIYSVLSVGLHSGGGAVQDASSLRVEAYLDGLRRGASVGELLGEQLRHGRDMPGFGHRAYPQGDPRAALILDMLRDAGYAPERMARLDELLAIQVNRGLPNPNIGFALASLAYLALMVRGAGEVVFNLARCAGWAAHALEEYENPRDMPRLQSVYVGPPTGIR